jgi:tRNA threonylcarbamoyl adenosine modification protein (Sua5/YciO/YrdC/YwlC family)
MRTIEIHPEGDMTSALRTAAQALTEQEAVVAYPTETGYALGCVIGASGALKRIQRVRGLGAQHRWTLLCHDMDCLRAQVQADEATLERIEEQTPDAYTFLLRPAEALADQLPPKGRDTVGIRIAADPVARGLVAAMGQPLVSTSARPRGEEWALDDPIAIAEECGDTVDLLLDAGTVPPNPSTVVDLTGEEPVIVRYGAGDPAPFGG